MDRKKSKAWLVASVALGLYGSIVIFLLFNTISASLKTKNQLIQSVVGWPQQPTLQNYRHIIINDGFLRYMLHSVILTVLCVAAVLLISSMVAYGLARYRFKGRNFLQMFFLLGLMFPIQLGILPNFILLNSLGLIHTYPGMVLLYAANLSFPFFIFYKSFQTLPSAMEEAARIDGAGEFRIFFRIMAPIAMPVFVTVGLINFVTIWNDFYLPLVFLSKANVKPLTLATQEYLANFLAKWELVFPAVTLAVLPMILVFMLGSERIVDGLTAGSTKL